MPKAETMDVTPKEPRDVKRAAASEGIGGKDTAQPVELAPSSGPSKLQGLAFFDMLKAMSERDWEDRMVYLYRQDKSIIKADPKDANYIARIPHAFDEAYVKEKFGGGRFLCILKNTRINGAERKHSFLIEGDPIIQADEVNIKKKQDEMAPKGEVGLLLEQMNSLVERVVSLTQKNGAGEQDAVSRVVETMKKATEGVLDVQKAAFEKQLNSASGSPLLDKFLEAQISRLSGDEGKRDPMAEFTKMLALARELNGGKQQGLMGIVSELKGLAEVAKELGIKIGSGGGEAGGDVMDWKTALAANLPTALQTVGSLVDRWIAAANERQQRMMAQMEAQIRARTGLPPAPPPVQAYAQPAAAQAAAAATTNVSSALPANFAPAAPQQQQPADRVIEFPQKQNVVEMDLSSIASIARKCFDKGDPGDCAALILKRLFGDEQVAQFMPYMEVDQLKLYCGMDPSLAGVVNDPEFLVFLAEFVAEMKKKEEEPEPTPEQSA